MSKSAFIFDSFVATGKNISFLSGGQQFVADVEKFDEMNPSNTNNGKFNHWNIVNEDGKILHNVFKVEDFKPQSAVFKVKRGSRTNTQRDRIDTRPPISGCPQLNLCQQTNMFFTLDKLTEVKDIKSDTRSYVSEDFTVKTYDHPDGISLTKLILDESETHSHDEELRKYPSVKFMYSGYDTVHDALTHRFAPSGDFRTPNEISEDNVGSGWQYIKNFNASEHIAIFNDIFNGQEITLFGDAVSTKTYYDHKYSVDGQEYAKLSDGSEVHLNDTVTDASLIPSLLNYTVVAIGKQDWVRAFPDDSIAHNIFEFKLEKCKWVDQDFGSMSFVVVNESSIDDIDKVPYEFLTHAGCERYQIGARCRGGVLKVRFSIPYTKSMTLAQFKEWIASIGSIKLKNNPSIPNADYRKKRFIILDGSETWGTTSGGALEISFTEKCCDQFERKKALAPMPTKLTYIGATEKDFTQSIPFNTIGKQNFKVSGATLNMSDAAIAGKCATTRDATEVVLRARFWRGSYDVTTPEEAKAFFSEHPLLIKLPSVVDDVAWSHEEDVPPDTDDNFYPNDPHYLDVQNVRTYNDINVCGPLLYLVYKHALSSHSQDYIGGTVNSDGFIPIRTYSQNMRYRNDEIIQSDDELEELIEDPDRNETAITVLANYETVESVNSINRLGLGSNTIKSNLFSVSISNLGLDNNTGLSEGDKDRIRRWITEKVEGLATRLAPAHTQLFKTFIND